MPRVPLFLVGFLVLFTANSTGWIPAAMAQSLVGMAPLLLLLAITALGMKTSLRDIIDIGVRPVMLLGLETLFLAVLVLIFLSLR